MFGKLSTTPAPAPKVRASALPMSKELETFAKQIIAAPHGLHVENVDDATVATVKATLKAHREKLFGAKLVRFRVVGDKKDVLRINLVEPKTA